MTPELLTTKSPDGSPPTIDQLAGELLAVAVPTMPPLVTGDETVKVAEFTAGALPAAAPEI